MTDDRLVRSIAVAFDELAEARTPAYLEAAIEHASSRPQRPAWTYPGRWLPMDIPTTAAPAARMPWRQIGILALLAVLVATATAIVIGSRSTDLPAPYGQAGNGFVAYARGGDILVADPVTGAEATVIGGPDIDSAPRFSRDGSLMVFERAVPGAATSHVVVADADGGGARTITDEPVKLIRSVMAAPYTFSPDGRTVAIVAVPPEGGPGLLLAPTDGSAAPRWLDLSAVEGTVGSVREPGFRPTDPNQLLLTGDTIAGRGGVKVFTVDITTGAVLETIAQTSNASLDTARWSPDGMQVSYITWSNASYDMTARTHVVAADGTGDRLLPAPAGMAWDLGGAWSNDGTRMLVVRGYSNGWDDTRAAIVPIETGGSAPGVEIPYDGPIQGGCCYAWEWSPDDTMILGKPIQPSGVPGQQVLVDVGAATISDAPWETSDDPVWQRTAP